MKMTGKFLLALSAVAFVFATLLRAADPKTFENHMVKSRANEDGPDHVQHAAAGPGWFSNLGPTGIRAMLTDAEGKVEWEGKGTQYLVKYVFPGSPAHGLVKPGDIIIGLNGRRFQKSYTFGYWFGFGYDGPLTEFGEAVEASEARNEGRLKLVVVREGKTREVEVRIRSKGAFAPTFPVDCKKSTALRQEAIRALLDLQKGNGRWPGQFHASWMACIALMAQGTTYLKTVQAYLDRESSGKITDGDWHWQLAMKGIAMAEYQMMTGDRRYYEYMLRINDQFKRNSTRFRNGTYGHVGLAEGSGGYGPMCGMTSFVLLSRAVMGKAGVPIHDEPMTMALTQMDMALVEGEGGYPYGWPERGNRIAVLDAAAVVSALGDLHSNIADLHNKARTAGFPVGNMALVHTLRPWQDYSSKLAAHHTNRIARCRNVMVTGHGSGMLHGWSTFVALCMAHNRGAKQPLRLTLDYNKGLLNSARCHDGSFYCQPQRDDLGGDLSRASRTTATALWLTVLSAHDKALCIFGKDAGASAKATGRSGGGRGPSSAEPSVPKKEPVPARPAVDAGLVTQFDTALMERTVAALASGARPSFYLRRANGNAQLEGTEGTDSLIVETRRPQMRLKIQLKQLSLAEKRSLALALLTEGKPEDHALVAFYSLAIGDLDTAQIHMDRAGKAADAVRGAVK